MVCCLYVGKCFSVVPHHMRDHMVTLAWQTRPHKIRSQIYKFTCEAFHVYIWKAWEPPPQRATPARKGARCGAGAGSTRPHRPHPGHTGRRTLAARSGGRAVGGGTAPDNRRPSQRRKAPPPGTPFRHPHSEQRRPARAHAVGPVLGPHARIDHARDTRDAGPWLPAPEDGRSGAAAPTTPSQEGGNRDRTAPPQARQTEHGTGAGHAEGHGPRGTALPAPSAGTTRDARATPPSGGGSRHRESASAHTRKGHAGTTGGATEPSARNAQTAWNGVPAREGKGHPDGTARHTQRGTRGAGRGKQERHNTRYRPEPPPNRPRAPRTHRRDTAPAKAVVAHSATPQPLG